MLNYPEDIRRVIHTTNAIESVNSVISKATTRHKMFPNDEAALKVIYLAIDAASQKWPMSIRSWRLALNRFSIELDNRITKYLKMEFTQTNLQSLIVLKTVNQFQARSGASTIFRQKLNNLKCFLANFFSLKIVNRNFPTPLAHLL